MEKIKRYIVFFGGLFCSSLGVDLVAKTNLGMSPLVSIPYVLSLITSMTLGELTSIFNIIFIVLQLLILRKKFKLEYWFQIPISFMHGYFIDFAMIFIKDLNPETYTGRMVCLLVGCVILGLGVYLQVAADVAMLPGESFNRAIAVSLEKEFTTIKVYSDITMTIISIVISLIYLGRIEGIGEGTIILAILVGVFAKIFKNKLSFVELIVFDKEAV